MDKTKFTPGPYHIEDGDDIYAGEVWLGWSTGIHEHEGTLVPDPETAKANTHLFVAAPALYVALDNAKEFLWLINNSHWDSWAELGVAVNAHLARVEAALALARGESPIVNEDGS